MRTHLVFTAALAAIAFTNAAHADAVVVVGEGPEKACYQAAKTGKDIVAGVGHCNLALKNPLIVNDRVATMINRGVLLHKLERVDAALEDFNAALRINPEQADAYINRGVVQMSFQKLDEAMADIQRGIALGPSEPALAYYNRAIAFERMGKIPEAYYDYQRSLKAAPGFTAAANALTRFRVTPRT